MTTEITMNRPLKYLLFFFLSVASTNVAFSQANFLRITDYKILYGWATHAPQDYMILRQFENEGKSYYLLVDPRTLVTRIDQTSFYQVKPMSLADACLVRMSETLPDPMVLTTDSDFKIYRRHSRQVIPCLLP